MIAEVLVAAIRPGTLLRGPRTVARFCRLIHGYAVLLQVDGPLAGFERAVDAETLLSEWKVVVS